MSIRSPTSEALCRASIVLTSQSRAGRSSTAASPMQNVQIRLFQGLEYRMPRNPVMIPSLMFIIPIVFFVGLS
jgi:hypothetical protein